MKLGTERNKVVILGGLLLVALYLFISGDDTEEQTPPSQATQSRPAPQPQRVVASRATPPGRMSRRTATRGVKEFRPSLKPLRPEDRPDPMTIDPTLRLDLLAKLQGVETNAVKRSLFEFSKPPAPKAPEPKILPEELAEIRKKQQEAAKKAANQTTRKPPPPPINLTFYGFINPVSSSDKRAFFKEGEDIFVAAEGDLIKKGRYKIVKIGINSAEVEDTEHKHKQTLKLEDAKG